MHSQQPMGNTMECPHPKGSTRNIEKCFGSRAHFGRCFVRERDSQHALRRCAFRRDEPSDSVNKYAGLSRTSSSDD
jgi:hypothetical protein